MKTSNTSKSEFKFLVNTSSRVAAYRIFLGPKFIQFCTKILCYKIVSQLHLPCYVMC